MSTTTPAAEATQAQGTEHITPSAAAKLVNQALEAAGLDKRVRPQMMYNYTTARLAKEQEPLIAFTREGGVDREDLVRWTRAYIDKQRNVASELEPLDLGEGFAVEADEEDEESESEHVEA